MKIVFLTNTSLSVQVFHCIGPYANSVYRLGCQWVICCPLLDTTLPGELETSGQRVYRLYWLREGDY